MRLNNDALVVVVQIVENGFVATHMHLKNELFIVFAVFPVHTF